MYRDVILPAKRTDERLVVQFPFGDQLQFGETITGAVVTAVVAVGTDPLPSDILFGSASVSGSVVSQTIEGGIAGVIYQLVCAAAGSGGNTYTKGAKQAVTNAPGNIIGP